MRICRKKWGFRVGISKKVGICRKGRAIFRKKGKVGCVRSLWTFWRGFNRNAEKRKTHRKHADGFSPWRRPFGARVAGGQLWAFGKGRFRQPDKNAKVLSPTLGLLSEINRKRFPFLCCRAIHIISPLFSGLNFLRASGFCFFGLPFSSVLGRPSLRR